MPLIISPKTDAATIDAFTKKFDMKKVSKPKFWHGNFVDSFYTGLDGKTNILFTGYSGAVAGYSVIEYAENYLKSDPRPEIYFVGRVFAFRDSYLEPGDITYARDTFSPDSFEQSIYNNAKSRDVKDVTLPNGPLLSRVLSVSNAMSMRLKPAKVYCTIVPGYVPDFTRPMQLMDEGLWRKLSLGTINDKSFDSGEYESASVLACSRLFGIPAVALLDVKDKRYSESDYRIASFEQKINALDSILTIVKESIIRGY